MNLNNYNVKELGIYESAKINGGSKWLIGALFYYAWEFANNPQAHIDAFMEGWNAARD